MTIRVLIVDDDAMAASGMEAQLASAADIAVVGRCSDGDQVAGVLGALHPDVVLCDMRMPRMSGPEVVAALRDAGPRFLMMTAFDDDGAVFAAIEAGADGFLLKGEDPHRFIDAVRSVARGDGEFSPRVAKQIAMWVRDDPQLGARRDAQANVSRLTAREFEFAKAAMRGASDGEISAQFFVAETTVKSTLRAVRDKWGVRTRTDVAVIMTRAGVL